MNPEWKLIIAPHVIGEEHLRQIVALFGEGRKVVRYTRTTEEEAATADVLIIDCFGLLSSIYRYGCVAYVGGGFGVGIHNVLEAAVWDIPVVFGPNNKHFQEAQGLLAVEGGFEIIGDEDFATLIDRFCADREALRRAGEEAGRFVKSRSGASDIILSGISL